MSVVLVLACLLGFLAFRAIRTPALGLVALYCMYAFEQWAQANSALFLANRALLNVAVAIIVAIGLAARYLQDLSSRERVLQFYPVAGVLVGLLFFYAFLSTLWTSAVVPVTGLWLTSVPYWLVSVFAAPLLFKDHKDLSQAFAYQIIFGGVMAALLFFGAEWQGRVIVLNQATVEMTQVGQGNPLATAEMAGITILCATFASFSFRGGMVLRLAATAICLLVIVRSGSRGQLLGLAFAVAAAFPIRYSIVRARVFATTAFIGVTGLLLVGYGLAEYWGSNGRFSETGAADDYAVRLGMAGQVLTAWLADTKAVVFGLGNSAAIDPAIVGFYPHVVPVEILAEEGLIGAMLYLGALVAVAVGMIRAVSLRGRDVDANAALATCVAIILYSSLLSLKQGSMLSSTTFFMSVIIVAKLCKALCARFPLAAGKRTWSGSPIVRARDHAVAFERARVEGPKLPQHAR